MVSVIECALAPIAVAPSAVTTIMEGATPAVGGFEIDLHARVGVILWRSAAAGSFLCWQSHASSKDIVATCPSAATHLAVTIAGASTGSGGGVK
jgi:hypothetical protein